MSRNSSQSIAGPNLSVWLASSSVGFSLRIAFGFITFAAILFFAVTLILAYATLFLTAVLFVIAIVAPIVTPLFASVVSNNQVGVVDRS